MNPLALFFASGESLYPGAALLLIAVITEASTRPLVVWLRGLSAWVGLMFIVMSSPPIPLWIDFLFACVFLWWTIGARLSARGRGKGRFQKLASLLLVAMLLGVSISEFRHRRLPIIQGSKSDHLVILGDSISAGLGLRVRPWPDVMKEVSGAEIVNLSRPGATMTEGLSMADRVTERDTLVLVELGGNNLIGEERPQEFEASLARLLMKLNSPGRRIVMFELPLLPQFIRYGQIQRRLAAEYRVPLIPKRCLAEVISGKEATVDSLHLSDVGSHRMASLVTEILKPVLQMGATAPTTPATHP